VEALNGQRRPATLLERLLSPLARAEAVRTWPPAVVDEHWQKVEDYRRRYENDRGARLSYATEFSRTAYGRRIYTPVGLAREVCNFSAEMLFSAPPTITFEDDEDLLEGILDANGLDARLTAIAAMIATEGRGGLRIINDENVADVPLITHVHEDEIIWDERHGSFIVGGAVIIERQPKMQSGITNDVYRLVEEHTKGAVSRQLYRGTGSMLGSPVDMGTLDEFAGLPEEEKTGLDVPTLIRWDNVSGGYSDLAGAEAILDRIDAEVSYGAEKSEKSRPVSYADASLFDANGRVDLSGIIPLRRGRMRELEDDPTKNLAGTIQPEFQAGETIAWIDFLTDAALMFMGYSKASYGRDEGGSADSGKALRLRQARTLLKKAGKDRMAVEAITNALAVAMAWHDSGSKVADYRTEITLGDGLPRDSMEDAQEAVTWDGAGAISLEEKIRTRRPEWDEDAIDEEVERIRAEAPAPAPAVPQLNLNLPEEEEDAQELPDGLPRG
jgi:Phage portal protein, SPP1 Gp6-like